MSKSVKNKSKSESKENDKTEIKTEIKSNIIEFKSNNTHNPYVNTVLSSPIILLPNQMDNKFYLHLKSNLNNKLIGKCYKNYGFIHKIFAIEEISDGVIEAEDPSCSAKIIVKFSCTICIPIINKELICKIDRMNKALISAINGPIKVIITADKINKDAFFIDINRNIRVKDSSVIIVPNMYIRILVLSRSFSDYDKNILVIGYLQDIANKDEINEFNENYNLSKNDTEINNFEYND